MLLRDRWRLLFRFSLSEHLNADTVSLKEIWCFIASSLGAVLASYLDRHFSLGVHYRAHTRKFSMSSSSVLPCFSWLGCLNLNRIKTSMTTTHSISWKQCTSSPRNAMVGEKMLRKGTETEAAYLLTVDGCCYCTKVPGSASGLRLHNTCAKVVRWKGYRELRKQWKVWRAGELYPWYWSCCNTTEDSSHFELAFVHC